LHCTVYSSVPRLPAYTANLITNPGFEQDENKDGVPGGWEKHQRGAHWIMKCLLDKETAHSGNACAKLTSPEPVRGGFRQKGIPIEGGKEYIFKFWEKSEGLEGSGEERNTSCQLR